MIYSPLAIFVRFLFSAWAKTNTMIVSCAYSGLFGAFIWRYEQGLQLPAHEHTNSMRNQFLTLVARNRRRIRPIKTSRLRHQKSHTQSNIKNRRLLLDWERVTQQEIIIPWKRSSGWFEAWLWKIACFRTGCRNVSRKQQSFSGLPSPRWSFTIKVCHSRVPTIFLWEVNNSITEHNYR